MAKNKNTLLLIIGAGALAYFLWKKNRPADRVTVTADNPIKQSAEDYETDYQDARTVDTTIKNLPATPLQTAAAVFNKIFLKKTTEQKAEKKSARVAKRTAKKAKKKVAGFDDVAVLY